MTTWNIDPLHSEAQFKVKHLVISTVTGSFRKFDASVQTPTDNFEGADVRFEADINSIDTGQEQRDAHLKSDDFFNAEQYPKLTFEGKVNDGQLSGNLTIRDVTKPVKLEVEFGGSTTDPYGQVKAGFEISGKINRKDFGLNWSAVTEAGGLVVSDDVKLSANVQFLKAS